jgi:hypothetical protein
VRPRLSFANVTSMLALFIALGGTSYAAVTLSSNSVTKAHLRTNSVGKSEIRARAVGKSEIRARAVGRSEVGSNTIGASELRTAAVGSNDVRDESLALADLAPAARTSLAELNGVTFRASGTAAGTLTAGNARSLARTAPGVYAVELGRDVSACQYSADVTGVKNGAAIEEPTAPGLITASPSATATQVVVRTYNTAAPPVADDRPFSLLVAC